MTIALIIAAVLLVALELRMYREIERIKYGCSNSSCGVRKGQKKAPAEAEAKTGIEYGGTHLP